MQLFFLVLSVLVLNGCAERLPEEHFVLLPSNDFPKLGYVPDRPVLPTTEETNTLKAALLAHKDASTAQQQEKQGHVLEPASQ